MKPPQVLPVYDDHEITADSRVQMLKVDEPTALCYRDLFIHRLPTTGAFDYFLLLMDGQVMTSIGLNDEEVAHFKSEYIYEMFGIAIRKRSKK